VLKHKHNNGADTTRYTHHLISEPSVIVFKKTKLTTWS